MRADPGRPRAPDRSRPPGSRATAGTPIAGAAGRPPPTSSGRSPGRRCALWAHDHHALLASRAAMTVAGLDGDTADPPGGVIRRDADGAPEGVLHEAAARLVTVHVPPPTPETLEAGLIAVGRELLALGVVAVHDPGGLVPEPDLDRSFPVYARLSDAGRLPIRVHVSLRAEALETAIGRGLHSGDTARRRTRLGRAGRLAEVLRRRLARLADRRAPRGHRSRVGPPVATGASARCLDDRTGPAGRAGGAGGIGRHRRPDPRDRRRGRPDGAGGPGTDRAARPAHAAPRARPAARSGRSRQLRGRRDRGQRPARPSRVGRGAGTPAVGGPGGTQRLHVGLDRRDRCGHAVRHRCAGRAVRPVAGHRPGRAPRGPPLAGRHAVIRAGRGALDRARAPGRLSSMPRSPRGSRTAAA